MRRRASPKIQHVPIFQRDGWTSTSAPAACAARSSVMSGTARWPSDTAASASSSSRDAATERGFGAAGRGAACPCSERPVSRRASTSGISAERIAVGTLPLNPPSLRSATATSPNIVMSPCALVWKVTSMAISVARPAASRRGRQYGPAQRAWNGAGPRRRTRAPPRTLREEAPPSDSSSEPPSGAEPDCVRVVEVADLDALVLGLEVQALRYGEADASRVDRVVAARVDAPPAIDVDVHVVPDLARPGE